MLLDKLQQVRTAKTDLFVLQKRFYAELTNRFPFIMHADMAKMTNDLESELHLLLCSSLKFDSIKIQLTSSNKNCHGNGTNPIVNVQRGEAGFYFPQSQRGTSDIHYMNLENYIKDNGDMHRKYIESSYAFSGKLTSKKEKDELKVALSELKSPRNEKRIVPRNLDAYFKLMPEVMAYRPKFLCYTEEGYDFGKGIKRNVGKLTFDIRERSMNVNIGNEANDFPTRYHHAIFKYNPSMDDLFHLLDYSEPHDRDFGTDVHERLKLFIENYEKIKLILEKEEARKKKAYQICKGFLKQIRVYTLPFKVLNEIKK